MGIDPKDKRIIQELAKRVAEIAALPQQQETIRLWKALNGLKPVRPMVTIDQVCWHEMDVDGELAFQTADPFCQKLETRLRRTLYQWKHFPVDMVVEPHINIAKTIRGAGFGLERQEKTAALDPANDVVGHYYYDQLPNEEDVEKIQIPQIRLDAEATARDEQQAHEIFDGILEVRMQGLLPNFAPWDQLVQWRGVETVLADLAMWPEYMHRLISRLTDAHLALHDQLEAQGLYGYGQSLIHCTGAHTDELPAPGFDPRKPRARDLWIFGMAQIFSSVSPAMHEEYELQYAHRIYERFGLVYYGCCEPLDDRIDILASIPHLRKISMSPWVNVERGAAGIGPRYVFSRKPSPAFLARDTFSPEAVEKDLRETAAACARHGCPLEFILKDISTVRYEPRRLWQWADIAMQVIGA